MTKKYTPLCDFGLSSIYLNIYTSIFSISSLSSLLDAAAKKLPPPKKCSKTQNEPKGYMQKLLPDEVLLKICSYSTPKDLVHLSCTCKRLQEICRDVSLW